MSFVGIAQLMVMLDSTVVNVALPSIGHQLPADSAALQWAISAYVLVYGSLLLFGGRLADVIGRRRGFLIGLCVFAAASAGCGIATNEQTLIGARAVQGLGAALLSAAALSIVISTYQDANQRKVALTAWSSLGVLGATIGVVLGGVIVSAFSWRWAFIINLPISLVTLIGTLRSVSPLSSHIRRSLRLPSAILATLGLACLSYGLIRLQDGFGTAAAWISIVAALVLLGALASFELGSSDPLLPLKLLRLPTYVLSSVGLLLAAAVMISGSYLGSLYFQRVHGMSALQTGLALLPMGLASLVVAFTIPKLIARLGPAGVYTLGAFAQLVGSVVLASNISSTPVAIIALAVVGAGLPSCFVPLYGVGTSHVRAEDSGVGSGLLNTFNQTGAALGIAVIGTVMAVVTANHLDGGDAPTDAASVGVARAFLAVAICAAMAIGLSIGMRRQLRPFSRKGDTDD
ncbi:MFS transporter [Flexivirga sp. ID2601S]|uniref:MFS transporter n=2 Tax=Flexivirga aerilata TaxID=1656889 RepID=A0A849AEP4_9MICO|nr:MFS transporter [Flexivirga aerilata]